MPPEEHRFPIVGLGASAGGLEALREFFSAMPADSGMGFVVVTHQHPVKQSLLPELLARETQMPVDEIDDHARVQPNQVYTCKPGFDLAIMDGVLRTMPIDEAVKLRLPIDYFFRSLADDQGEHAIGVILSGTGSDGSVGLTQIKGALGMVVVQDEQSAKYSGMPHSAIATERVDFVLPVSEIPAKLCAWAEASRTARERAVAPADRHLEQVFVLTRDRTGHDFSPYKRSTMGRRIERRMHIHRIDGLDGYVRYLQANPAEADLLFKELLIGVTSFFRDPTPGALWQAVWLS